MSPILTKLMIVAGLKTHLIDNYDKLNAFLHLKVIVL